MDVVGICKIREESGLTPSDSAANALLNVKVKQLSKNKNAIQYFNQQGLAVTPSRISNGVICEMISNEEFKWTPENEDLKKDSVNELLNEVPDRKNLEDKIFCFIKYIILLVSGNSAYCVSFLLFVARQIIKQFPVVILPLLITLGAIFMAYVVFHNNENLCTKCDEIFGKILDKEKLLKNMGGIAKELINVIARKLQS